MNSIVVFACLFALFASSWKASAVDPISHHGDPNLSTLKYCDKADRCKDYPYTKCVESNKKDEAGFSCLCEEAGFIEPVGEPKYNDDAKHFKLENCVVKKNMCDDPNYVCLDKANATCHFEVGRDLKGALKAYTFCTCNEGGRTLADRTHSCAETCHGECKNSDNCVYGSVGKDGKPEPVCNCKAGFTGSRCEKKVDEGKGAAGEAKSTTGYIVAIVILSVVSVIALAGVGVLFWKSRQ